MSTRILFVSLLSAVLCASALAQDEIMPEAGQVGLAANIRLGGVAGSELKRNGTTYDHINTSTVQIGATQTIRLSQKDTLRAGIERQSTSVDQQLSVGDPVVPLPQDLSSATASLAYTHIANQRWIFSGRVGAGSYVTDTKVFKDGWAEAAMGTAIYNQDPRHTYIFGLAYTSNLEDLRVLPVFGFIWRPAPKWSLAVGFPKTAATYRVSKKLSMSLGFSGNGGSYYVKQDPMPGVAPRALSDCWLQHREIRFDFNVNWKINQVVRISGNVGHVLYQKYKYVDRDFDLTSKNLALFFSLGGAISF